MPGIAGRTGPPTRLRSPHVIPLDLKNDLVAILADPVLFPKHVFGHDHWGKQQDILRSIAQHRRTAVKACHASGKTFTAADAALWWLSTSHNGKFDGIVITTAPTWTQVERLLWGEIHKSLRDSRIKYPDANKTELVIDKDNYAFGLSTNEGVRFQGFHGTILVLIDEAPGVREDIFEAIDGIMAGGKVHVAMFGNPIVGSGPFFDAFSTKRDTWSTFTISAFDTPNLAGCHIDNGLSGDQWYGVGDFSKGSKNLLEMTKEELTQNERPYLTTRSWVHEKYIEWGPGHPLWESKVLGQFPSQAEDALVSLAWIERAQYPVLEDETYVDVGIDVAGPGEAETSLTARKGPNIILQRAWTKPDPRGEVMATLAEIEHPFRSINVDEIGIGYYFMTMIRDRYGHKIVRGINVGEPARNADRFYLRKAELYWGLRDRFKAGAIGNLTDEKTQAQLASIRFDHTPRGQVRIESKEDMLKRGAKSPDRGESTILAFAPFTPVAEAGEFPKVRR